MRKIVLVLVLLVVASTAFAATWGVGASFGLNALGGLPQTAMLSLKAPSVPFLFGIGAEVGGGQFNLGMTADWWLYTQNLFSFVNLYVGPGLYLALPEPFELGGRLPIGFNAYPIEVLELFLEIAPTLVLVSNRAAITIPQFALQGAFGFRFWFNT